MNCLALSAKQFVDKLFIHVATKLLEALFWDQRYPVRLCFPEGEDCAVKDEEHDRFKSWRNATDVRGDAR